MDNLNQFDDRATLEHEARQWLVRMDGDTPLSAREKRALRDWLDRSPAHLKELKRVAEFWDSSNVLTELLVPMHQVAGSVNRSSSLGDVLRGWLVFGRYTGAMAMGLFVVVLSLSDFWFSPALDSSNGIYAAAIGELRVEKLADGSILQINTDSQVQVDYSEQVRKIRLLRGEAHFEVAHDMGWPFEVFAGRGRVKAVGTAFLVRLDKEQVDVIVTDGEVELAVRRPSAAGEVAGVPRQSSSLKSVGNLKQGQGASLNPLVNGEMQRVLAQNEIERQLAWRDGYLIFNGEPLSEVVTELNRYLPVSVVVADEALNSVPVGGRFKINELDALFEVLEASFNIQVSRLEDQRIELSLIRNSKNYKE